MAQVAYANELFELFNDECIWLSVDDKNKINMRTLAVYRYFQINRFFPVNDKPDYNDHDIPHPDCKVVPSGYLLMDTKSRGRCHRRSSSLPPSTPADVGTYRRSRSLSPPRHDLHGCATMSTDQFGRQHVNYGQTGNLHVFNRSTKFMKTSPQTHANDLHRLLSDKNIAAGKKTVLPVSDNGPDWNPRFLQTFVHLGRPWRDLQLDALVQTSYAAGFSCFNTVERAWAPLSFRLVGVTLPACLPEDEQPPWPQKNISSELQQEKEKKVYDRATSMLGDYWEDVTIDGFKVVPIQVKCNDAAMPYNDEKQVSSYLKAGITEHGKNLQMSKF